MFFAFWIICFIAAIVIADKKRLNIAGYVIFAIFLAPLALLAALLSPSRRREVSLDKDPPREDISLQLSEIKNYQNLLQQRIDQLEKAVGQVTGPKPEAENLAQRQDIQAHPHQPLNPQASSHEEEKFEIIFGRDWLNRIGVIVFVLGIGLFISYTFQYLNGLAKILIGYSFAIAFFVWGHILEGNEKYRKVAWGILGGAWGLLYLSTYAMYYIPVTKVIHNSFFEICLLTIVSIAAIFYNLKYQSWIVTGLAYVLGLITLGLGEFDFTTIMLWILLAASVVYLSYKFDWHEFFLCGIGTCYFAFIFWVKPGSWWGWGMAHQTAYDTLFVSQISFYLLTITWLLFSIGLAFIKLDDSRKFHWLVAGHLANTGIFALLGIQEIYSLQQSLKLTDLDFMFVLILAAVNFLMAYFYKVINKANLVVVASASAFSLFAWAILIHFPDLSIGFLWIIEMIILAVLGIYYKERVYRALAGCLSVLIVVRLFSEDLFSDKFYILFNSAVKHNVLLFFGAALCFFIFAALVRHPRVAKDLSKDEGEIYYAVFPVLATFLVTFILHHEISTRWISLAWTLQGAAILGAGFLLGQRVYRFCALSLFVIVCFKVIFIDMAGVNTIYKIAAFIVLGVVLLSVSLIYTKFKIKDH